ncbi:hypothetical protein NDI76_03360 [Halogeometricum sp. S1BR25-6]|uniref:MarR family transcriptional regulator n=1 Tax=Halogeometricum salsisoli TaxID=2950536 RepID=A0ABU2GBB1_9EURY|nr:hypothetical protein [Halogeometricum sp. S1BR25-6]MDS0297771.1 hypothetical protein [Halogeometricum sp. S1BR25-6]
MKKQLRRYWHYPRNLKEVGQQLRRSRHYIWSRKGVLLGYSVLILSLLLTVAEIQGRINLVPAEPNSELTQVAQIVGAFGSIALSFSLLVLYGRQTRILEQQYQPYLTAEIDSRSPVTAQFVVRNSGSDFAYDIRADWNIAGDKRIWEVPSLGPGDTAGFPIVIDDDNRWILNTSQIIDYLEENEDSSRVEYNIRCEDQFRIPRSFTGEVNINSLKKRQESNEIWDTDPLDSLANSASSIEASIDSIASDIDDRRDEEEWMDRLSKDRAIVSLVQELGEVDMDVLTRILKTQKGSLEYRLSELEAAGYLEYNKEQGTVVKATESGENYELTDFT